MGASVVEDGYLVSECGQTFVLARDPRRRRGGGRRTGDGAILSPMPGKIIARRVKQGDAVTKGQKLLTLEAMKMEHSLDRPLRWHSRRAERLPRARR